MKIILQHKKDSEEVVFMLPADPYKSKLMKLLQLCDEKCNGYVSLDVSRPYKPKTIKENAKYWAMCTEYGLYMNMTKEEVSDGIKVRAVEERGYPVDINRISKKTTPRSISKATTIEQSLLIDMLYQEASENGYIFDEQEIEEKSKRFDIVPKKESQFFDNEESSLLSASFGNLAEQALEEQYTGDIF